MLIKTIGYDIATKFIQTTDMKKPIKYTLYAIPGLVTALVTLFLLANYVFTTKLSLSCTGKETTSIYMGVKTTPIETKDKLEGVTLTVTKYPFRNPHVIIASENVYIITGTDGEITSALDSVIMGVKRLTTTEADIYRALTFNRLTRGVEIESIFKYVNNGSGIGTKFEGVCTEVKAL